MTTETKKQCTFCDQVQVYFGLDDEITSFSTKIAHEFLQEWPEKPWRLRPSSDSSHRSDRAVGGPTPLSTDAISDSPAILPQHCYSDAIAAVPEYGQKRSALLTHQSHEPNEAPIFPRSFEDQPEEGRHQQEGLDPNHLPQWWSQLRLLHATLGMTECLEEGNIIYVNSWYLHGDEARRCETPRVLRLDQHWQEWIDLLRETWQDRLHHDLPVDIGVVSPHPPATVFEAHAAHVILGQALQPHESPGIVSGIFRSSNRDAILHTAQILPPELRHSEAVALVPALIQCSMRVCMSRVGHSELSDDRPLLTPMYTSIVVEVHPVDEDDADFNSFMAAGARLRSGLNAPPPQAVADQRGLAQQEDEEEFGEEFPDDTDMESSTESIEDDPNWKLTMVFSIHGPPQEGQVNAVSQRVARRNVANLAHMPVEQLRAFHSVPHLPADLQQRGIQVLLAQHEQDVPEHPRLAFVLVDVEFHPAAPARQFERVLCPIYVPTVLSRHQILRVMDVFLYARFVCDTCLVWHNGQLIHQDAGLYVRLFHGDHIRIALPPPLNDMGSIPTRCIARLLQLGVEPNDIEGFYWLTNVDDDLDGMPTQLAVVQDVDSSEEETCNSDITSMAQMTLHGISRGRLTSFHRTEDFAALRLQYCQQQEAPLGIAAPNLPQQELPWFESELLPLWNSVANPGPGGMERMATILTWFNDHQRHPICTSPRRVTLFEDILEWRALITRVWPDWIDDTVDLHFFVVSPKPSHDHVDIAAHVILLQRPLPNFKSLHISVWDTFINAGEPRSWVLMFPNQLQLRVCIDIMGYTQFCQPVQQEAWCSLWHGEREIRDPDVFAVNHGMSIELVVQRNNAWQPTSHEETEHLQLLQTQKVRRTLQLEQLVHEVTKEPELTAVQLVAGVQYLILPQFLEVPIGFDSSVVERELRHWGHDCVCAVFKDFQVAVCYPTAIPSQSRPKISLYAAIDHVHSQKVLVDDKIHANTELEHMRLLYTWGFWRACLRPLVVIEGFPVQLVPFHNCEVAEQESPASRIMLPWPARIPSQPILRPIFDVESLPASDTTCKLPCDINRNDLQEFFHSANHVLSTTFEGIDLPQHVQAALHQCQSLDKIDRLLIYCDGSSLPEQRRSPPCRAEERGKGDTWAFVVLAEEYTASSQPKINLVGWSAQPVLFETQASHHIGSDKIGSETSEREALFWAALWRLSQNHNIATTFCTDSCTAECQGNGSHGAIDPSKSFRMLRATFQALEATLGKEHISTSHVRGHSGDPWNDLVDLLAKLERSKSFYLPRQNVDMRHWAAHLPFLWWMLAADPSLPCFHGEFFDATAPDLPPAELPVGAVQKMQKQQVALHVSLGSANVASLYAGEHGCSGKVQLLREQLTRFKLNVLGIQESRCPAICSLIDGVYRLGAGADRGHWGVELWFNLNQPIGHVGNAPIFLTKQDIVVLHQDPRLMLVRVDHPEWKANLMVGHAPQSGQTEEARTAWWAQMSEVLRHLGDESPLFVMLDANAAPGLSDGQVVGKQGFASSKSTPLLRAFLEEFHLCLPCTFACHQGPTTTWRAPNGLTEHCIDFVCIPENSLQHCSLSTTLPEFELFNGDHDHLPVAVQLKWEAIRCVTATEGRPQHDHQSFDRTQITRANVELALTDISVPSWSANIETHFEEYNQQIHNCLKRHCPKRKQGPKKSFFTHKVWDLRASKCAVKKQLNALGARTCRTSLVTVFQNWCKVTQGGVIDRQADLFQYGTTLICWRLKLIAKLSTFKCRLKRELQCAKKIALSSSLSELPPSATAQDILKVIKEHVGPTNPQKVKRKPLPMLNDENGEACTYPAQLLDRWVKFFGSMEGGTRMSKEQQWTHWRSNLQTLRRTQVDCRMEDLPTLTDLEIAFRRVPRRKASGLDQVPSEVCQACPTVLARQNYGALLKLFVHGQECLLHKGGTLTPAHKGKGAFSDPAAYRSLLVSSHIGKTLHRTIRQTQATLLENFMTRSQLGGKRKVPVTLGLHEARAYMRAAATRNASVILLMVDLVEAFYRVLRPLSIGTPFTDADIAAVAARLNMPNDILHQLQQHLTAESAVQQAGMPPFVQRVIQAIHLDTFFQVPGQEDVCRTTAGSRPGDSFADAVFTFLFARVLQTFQDKLQNHDLLEFIGKDDCFDPFGQHVSNEEQSEVYSGPVWMDDLCVTIHAETAQAAVSKAGVVSSLLLDTLFEHAMTPNLKRGKTELLFALKGAGVRKLKTQFFGPSSPGCLTVLTEHATHQVSVVGEYVHLGGILHHGGDHRREMRRRTAMAHQTFTAQRRTIFQNRCLTLHKRVQLFQSLVLSRLLYGGASWFLRDQKSKSLLHSSIMKLYRRLLMLPPDSARTDDEICVTLELPTPTELLRRERLRYVGTLHRCESTVSWRLLHNDVEWCRLVADDLGWLWQQIKHSSNLTDPRENLEPWRYIWRFHQPYWRSLIRRAFLHSHLQRQNGLLVRSTYADFLHILKEERIIATPPKQEPVPLPLQFGCMSCRRAFKSRGGEGAHMFRCHGEISCLRWLFDTTACPSCLREYHSFGRLKAHLHANGTCRMRLQNRPGLQHPAAGIGSCENEVLEMRLNGLLPPLPGFGPLLPDERLRQVEHFDTDLYAMIIETLFDLENRHLREALGEVFGRHPTSWTTFQCAVSAIQQHATEDEALQFGFASLREFLDLCDSLIDPQTWSFLRNDRPVSSLPEIEELEKELNSAEILEQEPRPQAFGRHRFVLHAFSGRRRPGDFQEFLDALTGSHSGVVIHVVSVDVILDAQWGDVTREECQRFWIDGVRQQYVVGYLAGPPCETWSQARGATLSKEQQTSSRPEPRVLRTIDEIWGKSSLAVREVRQVLVGNQLLLFSFRMLLMLYIYGGCGALEHPAPPRREDLASIWRTPLALLLSSLPGVSRVDFAQGLLGAKSPKPTSILTLNLPGFAEHVWKGRVCDCLPQQASIGKDISGRWCTTSLKEYPPALCRALALSFAETVTAFAIDPHASVSTEFWAKCDAMLISVYGTHIGPDYAG